MATPEPDALLDLVRELAAARIQDVAAAERVRLARDAFDIAHADLLTAARAARATVEALDKAVRELAVERYHRDGQRHPAPGIGIQLRQRVLIDDRAAALTWATAHPECLDLNTRKIEAAARVLTVPGVRVHEEAVATITTQLTDALTGGTA